ncbi:hypothetical protein HELRODRAFT_180101 [Helobdella robusta]|uniref:Uncharacterized protein n=1 Tax=Helobdella robusta TaxID=6412 RepID=T1FFH2_HELRO|nr:hypothetical protein HELRODRAFT_180101 [Helobdella robusta]ESN94769.1 hypothetical protein HELRODRAFT_180101 [Helobdella robusta]
MSAREKLLTLKNKLGPKNVLTSCEVAYKIWHVSLLHIRLADVACMSTEAQTEFQVVFYSSLPSEQMLFTSLSIERQLFFVKPTSLLAGVACDIVAYYIAT